MHPGVKFVIAKLGLIPVMAVTAVHNQPSWGFTIWSTVLDKTLAKTLAEKNMPNHGVIRISALKV